MANGRTLVKKITFNINAEIGRALKKGKAADKESKAQHG
jgi:hypothetical protein